jgi:hypothetical protein
MPPFYLAESNLTKDVIVEYYTLDINLSTPCNTQLSNIPLTINIGVFFHIGLLNLPKSERGHHD